MNTEKTSGQLRKEIFELLDVALAVEVTDAKHKIKHLIFDYELVTWKEGHAAASKIFLKK